MKYMYFEQVDYRNHVDRKADEPESNQSIASDELDVIAQAPPSFAADGGTTTIFEKSCPMTHSNCPGYGSPSRVETRKDLKII